MRHHVTTKVGGDRTREGAGGGYSTPFALHYQEILIFKFASKYQPIK